MAKRVTFAHVLMGISVLLLILLLWREDTRPVEIERVSKERVQIAEAKAARVIDSLLKSTALRKDSLHQVKAALQDSGQKIKALSAAVVSLNKRGRDLLVVHDTVGYVLNCDSLRDESDVLAMLNGAYIDSVNAGIDMAARQLAEKDSLNLATQELNAVLRSELGYLFKANDNQAKTIRKLSRKAGTFRVISKAAAIGLLVFIADFFFEFLKPQ